MSDPTGTSDYCRGCDEAIHVLIRAGWTPQEIAGVLKWSVAGVERELRWQASRIRKQRELKRKLRGLQGKPRYTPGADTKLCGTELGSLYIGCRAANALGSLGLKTITEFRKRRCELEGLRGVGTKTLTEIEEAISSTERLY